MDCKQISPQPGAATVVMPGKVGSHDFVLNVRLSSSLSPAWPKCLRANSHTDVLLIILYLSLHFFHFSKKQLLHLLCFVLTSFLRCLVLTSNFCFKGYLNVIL